MTLLTICQNVAREVGLLVPTTIVANTGDETAVALLAAAQGAGKALAREKNWAALRQEHTFTASSSGASYPLPADFLRFLPNTVWDRTAKWPIDGPQTGVAWQVEKSGITVAGQRRRWRVIPNATTGVKQFDVTPVPTATDSYVFEYMSDQWCTASAAGTKLNAFAADGNVVMFDEWLVERAAKWRTKQILGLPYAVEFDEYERERDRAHGHDGGAKTLSLSGQQNPDPLVPETGFG